jgi:DNA-binding NarL/FixJ family response regulator
MPNTINVLIVENDDAHNTLLDISLSDHPEFEVDVRYDGFEAVKAVKDFEVAHRNDPSAVMVVLMDLHLGKSSINGFVATRRICSYMERVSQVGSNVKVKVLIVTYHPTLINAFHIGARGCIDKNNVFFSSRRPHDGNSTRISVLSTRIKEYLVPRIQKIARCEEVWDGLLDKLNRLEARNRMSEREWQVAFLIARGYEYKVVGEMLRPPITENTVKGYADAIYSKISFLKDQDDSRKHDEDLKIQTAIVRYVTGIFDPTDPDF